MYYFMLAVFYCSLIITEVTCRTLSSLCVHALLVLSVLYATSFGEHSKMCVVCVYVSV